MDFLCEVILTILQNVKSKIAYSTDTWMTRQMVYTFACTIGSFIDDDWKIIERVVDFVALDSHEHVGKQAAKVFFDGAASRGGLNKISTAFTCLDKIPYLSFTLLVCRQIMLQLTRLSFRPRDVCSLNDMEYLSQQTRTSAALRML